MKLHHQILGSGPTLLIIGGMGDQTRNWLALANQLKNHFQVILLDNRDAGLSPRATTSYNLHEMTQDVKELCDDLSIHSAFVFGFSLGGKIALDLALTSPQLVKKLVLCGTGPAWRKPYSAENGVEDIIASAENSAPFFKKQFHILFGPEYRKGIAESAFIKFRERDNPPFDAKGFKRQLEAAKTFDCLEQIKNITCPTLILHGSDDVIVPADTATWMKNKIPQSELTIFEKTGHVVPAERPKEVIQKIYDFLATS